MEYLPTSYPPQVSHCHLLGRHGHHGVDLVPYKLRVTPEGYAVIHTGAPLNPKVAEETIVHRSM